MHEPSCGIQFVIGTVHSYSLDSKNIQSYNGHPARLGQSTWKFHNRQKHPKIPSLFHISQYLEQYVKSFFKDQLVWLLRARPQLSTRGVPAMALLLLHIRFIYTAQILLLWSWITSATSFWFNIHFKFLRHTSYYKSWMSQRSKWQRHVPKDICFEPLQ